MATLTVEGSEAFAQTITGGGGLGGFLPPAPTSNVSSGETVLAVPPPKILPPSLGGGVTLIVPPPEIVLLPPDAPRLPSASPCSTCKESAGAPVLGIPRPALSPDQGRPLAGLPAMATSAPSETRTLADVLRAQPWWLWVLLGFVAVKAFGRNS